VRGGLCPGDIGRRYGEHDKNFLLSAVKSAGGYLVFTDESGDTVETAVGISAHDPCAQTVTDPVQAIGSVVGNLLSTQFTLFDGGIDETTCPPKLLPLPPRKELGLVLYGHNVLGQAPRSLTVIVPRPTRRDDSEGAATMDNDTATTKAATAAVRQTEVSGQIGRTQRAAARGWV